MAYGVGLPPAAPVAELLELAEEVERLGYDYLWINDERLERDPFTLLAAVAQRTTRVRIGPGVTNPYSRHPALVATAMATIDELSSGRAVLGLGAGGTNHRALAVDRRAPVTALREAVELLRGLWAGATVTLDGPVVRANEAKLDFSPERPRIPIYIGARGPRVLELGGAVADGVIVGNVGTREGWAYALDRIAAGAARAGRGLEDVRLTAWLYSCVADDEEEAVDAIRPMAATSLVTSRPVLGELGIELPDDFRSSMEARDWSLARDSVTETGRLLPAELVHRFGVAGTRESCRARLRALIEACPEISQVAIVPFAARTGTVLDTVRRFIEDVASPEAVMSGGRS
ncbi:MAG: LLM class flavin-dependent oxidoreductase [Thermoleophilaceae bacterium]|nr:LLM class flavin-dependent oxidoreductase [Thermoleophilaceae bacterium]